MAQSDTITPIKEKTDGVLHAAQPGFGSAPAADTITRFTAVKTNTAAALINNTVFFSFMMNHSP